MKKENSDLDQNLKLIFKASLFVFFGTVLSKVFTYLYRIIIARDFGPETYGLFSLAIMILTWVVSFFYLGLHEGILRFIPLYRGKGKQQNVNYIFRYSFIALIFLSIVSTILLYLSSSFISINIFHNENLIIFLKILSFSLPFWFLGYFFLAIIQSYERIMTHSFISDILFNLINLVFLVILIFFGIKINSVIFSYFLGLIGVFLFSFFYCKIKIPEIFTKFKLKSQIKKKIKKDLLSYTWPLIFFGILQGIMANADSFIIGYFKSASDVGIYNAAILISGFMIFVPNIFIRLFSPLVTREFSKKNLEIVKELSKQVQKWIFIINLPLFVLMIIFPGAFINLLFGAEYMAAETSMRFLSIAFFVSSLSVIFSSLISMIGKSKLILLNTLVFSVSNVILNLILVPKYGISGAAFATMLSYIILTSLFFFQVKRYTSIIPVRRKMISIVLSMIPPTILLLYVKQFIPINIATIILEGSFFVLLYILFIFLTKSLDRNDFMILNSIRKNFTHPRLK
jgi:O-antigen/teichoic acid export membrane protein